MKIRTVLLPNHRWTASPYLPQDATALVRAIWQILTLLSVLAIAACGGGGGGSAPPQTDVSVVVSGLQAGQSVTVNAGTESLTATSNGTWLFRNKIATTATISVAAAPNGATCLMYHDPFNPPNAQQQAGNVAPAVNLNCSNYPAFSPSLPQLTASSGQSAAVIAHPRIVPIFFSNVSTSAVTQEMTFLGLLTHSSMWSTLSQYGVGAATVAPAVNFASPAGATFYSSNATTLLTTYAASWAGQALDANQYFVFFLPPGTLLDVAGAAAYHSQVIINGVAVSYAVVPLTSNLADQGMATHEIMEGVADPNGYSGISYLPQQLMWGASINNRSTEIGDMCELNTTTSADIPGFGMQPIWSNTAAAALQYPCIPSRYTSMFGAVPNTTQTLTGSQGSFPGVAVAPGTTTTIPIKLFATDPNVGIIRVNPSLTIASVAGTANFTDWVIQLDRYYGLNGEVLTLSIRPPATSLNGIYMLKINATDQNGRAFAWPMTIANSVNY